MKILHDNAHSASNRNLREDDMMIFGGGRLDILVENKQEILGRLIATSCVLDVDLESVVSSENE